MPRACAPLSLPVGGGKKGGQWRRRVGAEREPGPGRHGAGGDEQIHQPGEPGRLPPPHRGAAGHRHVFHRLVFRLRGDFYQVHTGHLQGAVDLAGGLALHGLRRSLPAAVGRYLCLRPGWRSTGSAL